MCYVGPEAALLGLLDLVGLKGTVWNAVGLVGMRWDVMKLIDSVVTVNVPVGLMARVPVAGHGRAV